jgi:hypothetical protein
VDRTEPHRDDARAAVRAAVSRVLHKRRVNAQDFEPSIDRYMAQRTAGPGGHEAGEVQCCPTNLNIV